MPILSFIVWYFITQRLTHEQRLQIIQLHSSKRTQSPYWVHYSKHHNITFDRIDRLFPACNEKNIEAVAESGHVKDGEPQKVELYLKEILNSKLRKYSLYKTRNRSTFLSDFVLLYEILKCSKKSETLEANCVQWWGLILTQLVRQQAKFQHSKQRAT